MSARGSHSPSRLPTSAQIDAVIAAAMANAPPAPQAPPPDFGSERTLVSSIQRSLLIINSGDATIYHATYDQSPAFGSRDGRTGQSFRGEREQFSFPLA